MLAIKDDLSLGEDIVSLASFSRLSSLLLILILGSILCAGTALAQGLATLRGTVTDSSGAVVPSATLTLTQVGTGLSRSVTTDVEGSYLIPALHPADYVLTTQATGFRQSTRKGITLLADKSVRQSQKIIWTIAEDHLCSRGEIV
jgi:hypothetical protein